MSNQHATRFGEQKEAFSIDKLKQLIYTAKNMNELIPAKKYLHSYFILCSNPHGVFMWRPDIKTFEHIPAKNIGMLIRPITRTFYEPTSNPEVVEKVKFNVNQWFMVDNSIVCVATCDPVKSRIYKAQGQIYLNIFPGFLHTLQPLSDFENKTHLAVKLIFMHIRDIWCSGDWNLTEYIIKWFAGISAGKKMYSILYLKSGQGWGKGIITDFIQRYVLGTQLVYKTSDPQTILGSFNGQLMGKLLLLLEEMPTEKSQWNSLYRALKDKVTSDTIEIHEKYKTPMQYKNFMSTIVLTNENALRVENDDRRTVFLDVSPVHKGDLQYFKTLGEAIKCPGAGQAFYAYLRAIANTYPDFDGNPPPMTTSKQEHIISTLPPLFQFIKDYYLINGNNIHKLPVQGFYNAYTNHCEARRITPLSKVNVSRIISNELNIVSKLAYIDSKRTRVLNITKEDLYQKFHKKNWIHETDEIDIDGIEILDAQNKPTTDPNALNQFLAEIRGVPKEQSDPATTSKKTDVTPKQVVAPSTSKQAVIPSTSKQAVIPSTPSKPSAPPPVPKKPEHLKVNQKKESAIKDLSAKSDSPISELFDQMDRNKYWKKSRDEVFSDFFNVGKELWAKHINESDEYDWEMLATETEELFEIDYNEYHINFRNALHRFRGWVNYNKGQNIYTSIEYSRIADMIRAYQENKNAEIIPTPSGYKTMKLDKGKAREDPKVQDYEDHKNQPKTKMEKEWEEAHGLVDEFGDEDFDDIRDTLDAI